MMPKAAMKTYRASGRPEDETDDGAQVRVEFQAESILEGWRQPYWLRNTYPLSAADFTWGYGGGGPTALAWSLLEDALGDVDQVEVADLAVSEFVTDVVAQFDQERGWELSQQEVLEWFEGWKLRDAAAGNLGVPGVLSRRVAWALRQSHPADRELQGFVSTDLRQSPAVRELTDPWAVSKLEVAAWVAAWLRAHPQEVDEVRAAWAERTED